MKKMEKLVSLIPEFQLIEDPKLHEQVIKVWIEAMKKGNWTFKDLEEMPFTLLLEKIHISHIEHTRAVTLCALKIAEIMEKEYKGKISINRDHLVAGALLHDVGKMFEFTKEKGKFVVSEEGKLLRHPISGATFASKYGLPNEVIHCIAAHSKEGDGRRATAEAIIINHADFVNFDVMILKP